MKEHEHEQYALKTELNTKADLTRFGTILSVTLLVGCVVSIINLFLGNGLVDIVLDWVILLVFMGFTVYDMNNLKNLYNEGVLNEEKLYVYGAMELYLDFINIFLRILSIFGVFLPFCWKFVSSPLCSL